MIIPSFGEQKRHVTNNDKANCLKMFKDYRHLRWANKNPRLESDFPRCTLKSSNRSSKYSNVNTTKWIFWHRHDLIFSTSPTVNIFSTYLIGNNSIPHIFSTYPRVNSQFFMASGLRLDSSGCRRKTMDRIRILDRHQSMKSTWVTCGIVYIILYNITTHTYYIHILYIYTHNVS